jgi:acyl-coenzyme A synthetase/AMP-(fatty) acid ligase
MNAAECLLSVGADAAVALECGDRRVTYAELRVAVPRAGAAWHALGLTPGARAVVLAPDSDDWVVAYLGAIWAGGVAIGINPHLALRDLAPILSDSEVRYVWCERELAGSVSALAESLPDGPTVVAPGGVSRDWTVAMQAATRIAPGEHGDEAPALWIGTSGTTGIPKGVIHPQRVVVHAHAFAGQVLDATAADRFYSTSKLFFAYALGNSLFAGLRVGATVILDRERATPERTREMIARHRPTLVFTVPTLYSKMLQENVAPDLAGAGIRHFVSAGEALPATVRSGWQRATGRAPISGYGTSETLCLALYCDDDTGLLHPTPLTLVRYADDIEPDIPQRISVRLPTLALGYWRRPEAQADGFHDGWFSPGDMFIRRDARLEFAGRTDDLLKVAGQWVSTLWIEHALTEAGGDAIDQVAAVGIETPEGLTTIAALAVAVPGREDQARDRIGAGIEKLPKYRRPRWVHWVTELPLTATGKLQRSRLRAAHESALSNGQAR